MFQLAQWKIRFLQELPAGNKKKRLCRGKKDVYDDFHGTENANIRAIFKSSPEERSTKKKKKKKKANKMREKANEFSVISLIFTPGFGWYQNIINLSKEKKRKRRYRN